MTHAAHEPVPFAQSHTLDTTPVLDAYYDRLYPMAPILSRARLEHHINGPSALRSPSLAPLLWSMCLLIELIDYSPDPTSDDTARCANLASTRMRREFPTIPAASPLTCDHAEAPDVYTCMASFHVFVAWTLIGRRQSAWLRLQEAISVLQILQGCPSGEADPVQERERHFLQWIL